MTQLRSVYPSYRSRKSIVLLVSLFVTLLLVTLVVTFSLQHSNRSVTTPAADPYPSTSASQVLTTYYHDIMNAHYEAAYTLLSTPVRQHLDLQGGARYLQNELEQFAARYGTIISYTATQSHSNATAGQVTYIVQITRTKLTNQQTETDTYRLVQQDTTWAIDQWTSDVNTK